MSTLASKLSSRYHRDYSPVSWTEYFDEAHDVCFNQDQKNNEDEHQLNDDVEDSKITNSFRVYLKNFRKPYAPDREFGQKLDSSQVELSDSELREVSQVPTLVALHGGGYSALTWAQFSRHIEQYCNCRILAIDLRSHGDTKTTNDTQMDIDTLVNDVFAVAHATHQNICGFPETPKIILIGHSMGGAIAVKCATKCIESLPSLAGFVIIDVVEGTAKDALPQMMSVIKTRPTKFPTLNNAIEWSVRSGMAKNPDAARVSMPGNLVNILTGNLSIHDILVIDACDKQSKVMNSLKRHKYHISVDQLIGQSIPNALIHPRAPLPPRVSALKGVYNPMLVETAPVKQPSCISASASGVIKEEEEDEKIRDTAIEYCEEQQTPTPDYRKPPDVDQSGYSWRTNLAKTQPFWNGWFNGLSEQLLNAPVQGKFLLLAGIDRLDKTLTIGQMQGRFMMKVLPKCGHAVHEDVPEQVARAIGDFLVRNKFASVASDYGV